MRRRTFFILNFTFKHFPGFWKSSLHQFILDFYIVSNQVITACYRQFLKMFMQVQRAGIQISSLWLGTIENGPASKLFRILILWLFWRNWKCSSKYYFCCSLRNIGRHHFFSELSCLLVYLSTGNLYHHKQSSQMEYI